MPRKAPVSTIPADALDTPRRRLCAWLAAPPPARQPKTQRLLADELGVDPGLLSRWKREPAVRRTVEELLLEENREFLPVAWASVRKQAAAGDIAAIRLILDGAQAPEILPLNADQRARVEALAAQLLADYRGQPGVYTILVHRLAHLEVLMQDVEQHGARLSKFVRLVDQQREVIGQIQRYTESQKSELTMQARVESITMTIRTFESIIAPENPELWLKAVRALEGQVSGPNAEGSPALSKVI